MRGLSRWNITLGASSPNGSRTPSISRKMMVLLPAVVHADDVVAHDIHTKFQVRFRHFMKLNPQDSGFAIPHLQRNEEAEAMGRQLQQTPQHAPSENHLTLQCASEIVRPSTTQSHPQPPHSTAQAEMFSPQRIAADNPDAGREQLLRDGNVHLDTSMPIVQHRPARAALQENDDVTHENPSSSFHIGPPSPQISNPLLPHNIQNPLTRLTPNLLACTRILSGRNLLSPHHE